MGIYRGCSVYERKLVGQSLSGYISEMETKAFSSRHISGYLTVGSIRAMQNSDVIPPGKVVLFSGHMIDSCASASWSALATISWNFATSARPSRGSDALVERPLTRAPTPSG
jgi:hypothetical protein